MDAAATRGEVPSPSPSPSPSVRFMNEKAAGIRKSLSVYVLCPPPSFSALLLSLPSFLHCFIFLSHDYKLFIIGLSKRTSDLLLHLHPLLLLLTLAIETRNCGYVPLSFFSFFVTSTSYSQPSFLFSFTSPLLYSSFSFYSSLISYQLTTTKEMQEEVAALRRGTPLSIPRFSCPSPLHLYFFPLSPLPSPLRPLPSPLSPLCFLLSPLLPSAHSPLPSPSPLPYALSLFLSPISSLPSPPSPLPSPPISPLPSSPPPLLPSSPPPPPLSPLSSSPPFSFSFFLQAMRL